MKSEWADNKTPAEMGGWVKKLVTAAAATGDEAAKTAAKAAATKHAEVVKKPNDAGTVAKLKSLYEAGVKAVTAAESAGSGIYDLKLAKVSSPKFWHNATNANKVPEWSYSFVDTKDAKDKGEFTIKMTKAVGENNENKQSELMNALAIAEVKKLRKDAKDVKLKG